MLIRRVRCFFVYIVFFSFSLFSCGGGSNSDTSRPSNTGSGSAAVSPTYQVPLQKNDGWPVASAIDMGANVALLEDLTQNILDNSLGFRRMDSLLVVKDGQLIFERQFKTQLDVSDSWASNTDLEMHAQNSVTKSIMSAAFGIAIEQGHIGGIEQSALSFFDEYFAQLSDLQQKQSATLADWLTMRHGFEWDEWDVNYLSSANQNQQMLNASDPMAFLLDLPLASAPGTKFTYSTGISYALGEIIARSTNMRFIDYVNENLFTPLGIDEYDAWYFFGDLHAGSGLYLKSRDMAKFGQMFLNAGSWQGQQVVPQAWVELSTRQHVTEPFRYGYQWWITNFQVGDKSYSSYFANGWGGQFILIFPELNSVVVATGHRYEDGDEEETSVRSMLEQFVLPAIADVN